MARPFPAGTTSWEGRQGGPTLQGRVSSIRHTKPNQYLFPESVVPIHYTEQAHAHYLTFSCYKRLWLFKNPALYSLFLDHLADARRRLHFKLYGFVLMPNHIHLLVFPQPETSISSMLSRIKGPFANQALLYLRKHLPELHDGLKVIKGQDTTWRFWQAGGGYDRNIYSDDVFQKTLEYMHLNPVRKSLVEKPENWRWSSVRYYQTGMLDEIEIDPPNWK